MQMELFDEFKPIKSNDWKWNLADGYPQTNGLKVFSCFACGGGSTMGYKLAGCEVLGCCEIDPKMNELYVANHHPKYNYCEDIREFNKRDDLPHELYDLDILDGSPPCTTFSMAGEREESWGKKKKFREGQQEQTLDDLSFVFIETARKLKPKCVIMENVAGLLVGEAWSYVQKIYSEFADAGYRVNHWLIKGERMGVPQKRHRAIFIAIRNDLNVNPININLEFNYEPIPYSVIKCGVGNPVPEGTFFNQMARIALPGEHDVAATRERLGYKKRSSFQVKYIRDNEVLWTLRTHNDIIDLSCIHYISIDTCVNSTTFPQDYNWLQSKKTLKEFALGMSVPPLMMKRVVDRVIESGIFNAKICYGK